MDILRLRSSINDLKNPKLYLKIFAELLGTFILVFVGSSTNKSLGSVYGTFGFGFGGVIAIYCIGNISGGHINPAVSFSLLIARKISLINFFFNAIGQLIGALIGVYCSNGLNNITSISNNTAAISNIATSSEIPASKMLVCEILITFLLTFVVMRMCVEENRSDMERAFAPFIIGMAIAIGVCIGAKLKAGSMNPAASIAGHIFQKTENLWVFIVGPLLGGAISGLFQQLLFTSKLSKFHLIDYLIYPEPQKNGNNEEEGTKKQSNDTEMKTV